MVMVVIFVMLLRSILVGDDMGLMSTLGLSNLPVVSTVASFAGNLLGMEADRKAAGREQEFALSMANRNEAMQREFAQHGVRWRVDDAKAAGLHPLFALGGSGSTFSPHPTVVGQDRSKGDFFRQTGQDISRAVSAVESADQRAMRMLTMDQMRASAARDWAQASYWSNEAARKGQSNGQAVAFPVRDGREPIESLQLDRIQVKPDEVTSFRAAEPDVTAGRSHPGWRETNMGRFRMLAPVNEEGWSEGLESMPLVMWPEFLRRNMEKYGRQWIADFLGIGRRDPRLNLEEDVPRRGPTVSGRIRR